MKIVKLTAENFKKLTAIEIKPDGNIVTLTGKNGAGKSSVLDAITVALCGKGDLETPIRKGEKKGKVVVDVGDFTVTRTFTAESDYLKVETKDGFERKSPQKFLDSIVGRISFDPMNFINAEPKEQRRILMELAGVNVDELTAKAKELYDFRTMENRSLKEIESVLKSLVFHEDAPAEKISVNKLVAQVEAVQRANNAVEQLKNNLKDIEDRIGRGKEMVEEKKNEIAEAQKKLSEYERRIKDLNEEKARVEKAISDVKIEDTAPITAQIDKAEEINNKILENKAFKETEAKVKESREKVEKLTKGIEEIAAQKEAALKAGKFPIPGLSFDESGVIYNGIPLNQISSAERVRVGLAISMALNPQLRVLRVTDGSLLDSDSWKAITEMAAGNDYQIWVEKVDESGTVGFFIEDGALSIKESK